MTGTPEPDSAQPGNARVVKRSIVVAGHRTSVSLEDAFWRALKDVAAADGVSLAALVSRIDAGRGPANLSSALRVFALEHAPGIKRDAGVAGR
jgi:predicted DNA-binding ribbon-helix-helix protein